MKKFINEFKQFAMRGNMLDMAIGVIIGGAFTGIVTSLTDNFINPILNFFTGGRIYSLQDIAVVAQDTIVSFNGQEKCASIPLIPEVDTSLNSLRNLILSGYHNGVPVRAIFNVICNAVEKLQVNEECKFEEQSRSI